MKFYTLILLLALLSCSAESADNIGNIQDNITQNDKNQIDISRTKTYSIKGEDYHVFNSAVNFQQVGIASWYGPGFHGKYTASGEIYNMNAMTAAHKTLPLGTYVEVTNLENNRKVVVRINDRGPFHNGRIIDLSKKAAKELGIYSKGQAKVHIKTVKY